MQHPDCHRRKAMAAVALNHYMSKNKDFISLVESKVEHFVNFVNEIQSDQNCPPKLVDYVYTLLSDWCKHFDSHKAELSQLLNDMTADRAFKKKLLEIVQNPSFFATIESRERLKDAVQRVTRSYLRTEEKTSQIVAMLLNRMEKSVQSGDKTTLANIFSLTGFLLPCSEQLAQEVLGSARVKQIYLSCLVEGNEDREYHQWFGLQKETVSHPIDIQRANVVLVKRDPTTVRPPLPPKPSKERLSCIPQPVEEEKPPVPPRRRTVKDVKNKGVSDPKNCFSLDSKVILRVMEHLPKIIESDMRFVRYLAEGAFGCTELVEVKGFELPVVAKMMKNGRNVSAEVLREQANLLKCIHDDSQDHSEKQVLTWISHISNALCSLHSMNLIHRDIKPANMLLTFKNGQELLKLCDFGMLKAISSEGNDGSAKSIFGTCGYTAPETWFFIEAGYSSSVDIYSFGVSVWEICQRKRPHLNENLESYDGSKMKVSLRPKLENPKYIWMPDLVTRMWQTDPSHRPTTVQVDEEIKNLLDLCS